MDGALMESAPLVRAFTRSSPVSANRPRNLKSGATTRVDRRTFYSSFGPIADKTVSRRCRADSLAVPLAFQREDRADYKAASLNDGPADERMLETNGCILL